MKKSALISIALLMSITGLAGVVPDLTPCEAYRALVTDDMATRMGGGFSSAFSSKGVVGNMDYEVQTLCSSAEDMKGKSGNLNADVDAFLSKCAEGSKTEYAGMRKDALAFGKIISDPSGNYNTCSELILNETMLSETKYDLYEYLKKCRADLVLMNAKDKPVQSKGLRGIGNKIKKLNK